MNTRRRGNVYNMTEFNGYLPKIRPLKDIIQEDVDHKALYEHAVDNDENITVKGPFYPPQRIDDWNDIDLNERLKENIERCGYIRPRKIQSYVIPLILNECNVKAQAETGSGKSAAFLIPLIQMVIEQNSEEERTNSNNNLPIVIVIAPTRELVLQICENAAKLADGTSVRVTKAYGEYNVNANAQEIMRGSDIVVATPGRLVHFLESSYIGLQRLRRLCLDEADLLLDESFKQEFNRMIRIKGFPKDALQILLFGATYPSSFEDWIGEILSSKYATVTNERANEPNMRIVQTFEECHGNDKLQLLLGYCNKIIANYQKGGHKNDVPRILIFVDECQRADVFAFFLNSNGIQALSLNSKRGQESREKTLHEFRSKRVSVIVATDVCSRGLDIKDLSYVINLDMPKKFATYVQRIGRTGRLQTGYAHSFIDLDRDAGIISDLVRSLHNENVEIPKFLVDSLPPYGRR